MRTLSATARSKQFFFLNKIALNNFWGYEIGLPARWNIDGDNKWSAEVEPYYLKLDTKAANNIYGGRLLMSYQF